MRLKLDCAAKTSSQLDAAARLDYTEKRRSWQNDNNESADVVQSGSDRFLRR